MGVQPIVSDWDLEDISWYVECEGPGFGGDGCGEVSQDPDEFPDPCITTEADAERDAMKQGWGQLGGKWYCPTCYHIVTKPLRDLKRKWLQWTGMPLPTSANLLPMLREFPDA